MRTTRLWLGLVCIGAAALGCAGGGGGTPGRMEGGMDAAMDAGAMDGPAPMPDAGVDSGRGTAGTCEACESDADCQAGFWCADLEVGGRGCLPSCNIDLPDCPARFDCVMSFAMGIPEPVCAPVGERCCVDEDGDLHGQGVGCLGLDCDETTTEVNSSAAEQCNGIDDNCDGEIDDGDPLALCPRGTHVATTACTDGACAIATCEPGFGDCDGMADNGCELSLDSPTHCGACDTVCALANATATCPGGTCAIGSCTAGFGDCNMRADDGCETALDSTINCGGCGVPCSLAAATSTCATGTCAVEACDPNWGDCDGRAPNGCETPLTTNANCGMCGTICAPSGGGGDCSTGTCRVSSCAAGYDDCDMNPGNGCETSIRTLTDCGACGVPCTFPSGTASCAAGACTLTGCDTGWGNCDGVTANGCETRLNTTASCGACGRVCAPAHATGTCSTGTCGIASCDAGYDDCDGNPANGCETSLRTPTDCGGCGVACTRTRATPDCATGACRIGSCDPLYSSCDGMDANGCETPLTTTTNCAGCGVPCARAHATAACTTGTCAIAMCSGGWDDCDGIDGNGCEASLRTTSNCGACGSPCARAHATATCASVSCAIAVCDTGWGDCDGVDGNGCETSLTTLSNCAMCGVACSRANGTSSCSTGTCTLTSCTPGWDNCDGMDGNGCETALNTLSDCGMCSVACSRAHASATCATRSCAISMCSGGWGNCDATDANGCEAPLTSLTNCGACGVPCARTNATATCTTGSCAISSCNGGYGSCDGNDANGCETPTNTLTNCGGCGVPCSRTNATATCSTGSCAISSCNGGYGSCDGNDANGCETPTNTLTDCGGCGVPCSRANATATCGTGSCAISSCNSGYSSCDAIDSNGCEVSHGTAPNSCASGTYVGQYDGDTSCGFICGGNTQWDIFSTRTGRTSAWFRARVIEDSTCSATIQHQIRLIPPAGTDYDLYVYRPCGTLVGSSTAGGSTTDIVTISQGDSGGSDDSFDYWVEVRFFSGASCSSWTLQFYGHNC